MGVRFARCTLAMGLLSVLIAGCDREYCDAPPERCDTQRCFLVEAWKLQADNCRRREGAACVAEGGAGNDIPTAAYRVSDQSCWVFGNSYLPDGFVELDESHECRERLSRADADCPE